MRGVRKTLNTFRWFLHLSNLMLILNVNKQVAAKFIIMYIRPCLFVYFKLRVAHYCPSNTARSIFTLCRTNEDRIHTLPWRMPSKFILLLLLLLSLFDIMTLWLINTTIHMDAAQDQKGYHPHPHPHSPLSLSLYLSPHIYLVHWQSSTKPRITKWSKDTGVLDISLDFFILWLHFILLFCFPFQEANWHLTLDIPFPSHFRFVSTSIKRETPSLNDPSFQSLSVSKYF